MKIFKKILLLIIFIFTLGLSYFFGYLHGHQNLKFYNGYIPELVSTDIGKPNNVDFSLFWDVWNKVEEKYPGKVDRKKLLYGAISGMLSGLDDPYSAFMEPGQSKNFLDELDGVFDGIGVEITMKDNQLTVVSPLKDSPAEKAGLKPDDVIFKIDGALASEMTLDEAVSKIRGKKGTSVTLTILRGNDTFDVLVKREQIRVESVQYEIKNNNIAYIKISQFGSDTEDLLDKAVSDILQKNPKGVILDLRNNPGGFLETSVFVSSLFIKDGVIVSEESKGGAKNNYDSTGDGRLKDYKLVVLINEGSASASEIVAGAIQDTGKGVLIGEKTYGKGSVQELESLKAGAYLRLTVAKWLTPKGRYINAEGIKPDIEVKITEKDIDSGKDPQLDKAIKELKK